jgi:BirA family biotin operon repressor/biotin-[acetyl-CoA-carboxylase] ligase
VLVLGIGINIHQRREDLPAELRDRAISLAMAGYPLDRLALLARLTRELDRLEDASERGAALDEWRRRSTFLGKAVEVRVGERAPMRGIATAIDDDGALLVRTSSGTERVVAGEVALA